MPMPSPPDGKRDLSTTTDTVDKRFSSHCRRSHTLTHTHRRSHSRLAQRRRPRPRLPIYHCNMVFRIEPTFPVGKNHFPNTNRDRKPTPTDAPRDTDRTSAGIRHRQRQEKPIFSIIFAPESTPPMMNMEKVPPRRRSRDSQREGERQKITRTALENTTERTDSKLVNEKLTTTTTATNRQALFAVVEDVCERYRYAELSTRRARERKITAR